MRMSRKYRAEFARHGTKIYGVDITITGEHSDNEHDKNRCNNRMHKRAEKIALDKYRDFTGTSSFSYDEFSLTRIEDAQ